jgi:hypothetical protein
MLRSSSGAFSLEYFGHWSPAPRPVGGWVGPRCGCHVHLHGIEHEEYNRFRKQYRRTVLQLGLSANHRVLQGFALHQCATPFRASNTRWLRRSKLPSYTRRGCEGRAVHRLALSADVPFVADSAQLSKKLTSAHYSQVTGATPLA